MALKCPPIVIAVHIPSQSIPFPANAQLLQCNGPQLPLWPCAILRYEWCKNVRSKTTETYKSSAFPGRPVSNCPLERPRRSQQKEEEDQTHLGLCSLSLVNRLLKLTTGTWPILRFNHHQIFANFPLTLQMTEMPHWMKSEVGGRPFRWNETCWSHTNFTAHTEALTRGGLR